MEQYAPYLILALTTSSFVTVIAISALVSSSLAGTIEKGEVQTFLSYPIKRTELLIVKIVVNVFIPLLIATFAMIISVLLVYPEFLFTAYFFVGILALLLQFLFVTSVSAGLSLMSKKVVISATFSVIFWYVMQALLRSEFIEAPYKYVFSPYDVIVAWVANIWDYKIEDFLFATLGPLMISVAIFTVSFIYIKKKFEVTQEV